MDNIMKHIIRAMELTGHEVLEEDYDGFIVSKNDGAVLFSEPQVIFGEIEEQVEVHRKRFDYEQASCMWFVDHDVANCPVMFCIAQLFVLSPDRGMLRHVVNWPNSHDIKCDWVIMMSEGRE